MNPRKDRGFDLVVKKALKTSSHEKLLKTQCQNQARHGFYLLFLSYDSTNRVSLFGHTPALYFII